jgi:hypothetical protein
MAKKKRSNNRSQGAAMPKETDNTTIPPDDVVNLELSEETVETEEILNEDDILEETAEEPVITTPEVAQPETAKALTLKDQLMVRLEVYKSLFDGTIAGKTKSLERAAIFTDIAVDVHTQADTESLEAYLTFLVDNPAIIPNIIIVLDTTKKIGNKERNSIVMMHSALDSVARAIRKKYPKIELNVTPLYEDIRNKRIINFITSKLG